MVRRLPSGRAGLTRLCPGPGAAQGLRTDTTTTPVPLDEIISGGPPPDGTPAIDERVFVRPAVSDAGLRPQEPVLGLEVNGDARASPCSFVAARGVVHHTLGGESLVVVYRSGTLSVLDDACTEHSRAVGATAVFRPRVAERTLTFEAAAGGFRDLETGTTWNLPGHALRGTLAGQRPEPVPYVDAFWFASTAFHPATTPHAP